MLKRILLGAAVAALGSAAAQAQDTGDASSARYQTPEGQLTVHSGQPGPRQYAAPPPFEQLAQGKAYITREDAQSYDLLANDFIYADSNRDGRISRAEYRRWTSQP